MFTSPGELSFDNYSALLGNSGITQAFWNTVLISVPTTVLVVVVAALAGYAFAWLDFPGREPVFLLVVALLVVPVQIGLLPVAKLFGQLGLFGTIPGVVLFHVAYGLPFAVFLLRNYFAEMPKEMLEAARMDGGANGGSSLGWCCRWGGRPSPAWRSFSFSGCGTTCWSRCCSRTVRLSR
ncbi:hypothetical protein SHKM778_69190 [Streptomyces sp. KM77-8]|uniref:ABC transmembrane type-1 domain-containing protein n=1 Tax=Streptomyces haneummycinicus TaxID=3074435 RepID=A0AAT9HT74_9ACTN